MRQVLCQLRTIAVVGVGLLGCLAEARAFVQVGGQPEVSRVLDAWNVRQAAIVNFDFSWAGDEFDKPGVQIGKVFGKARPETLEYKFKSRLVVDEKGRSRCEFDAPKWSGEKAAMVPATNAEVYDGKSRRIFNGIEPGKHDRPLGSIMESEKNYPLLASHNLAIRLALRPTMPTARVIDVGKLSIGDTNGIINGKTCWLLRAGESSIWVDPSRDYVPLRYDLVRNGVTLSSIVIEYKKDERFGWLPQSWKTVQMTGSGEVKRSEDAVVTGYAINQPIKEEYFNLDFPAGAWVTDYGTNETYIVRDGGEKRIVMPEEVTLTNYQELLKSDPPGTSRRWLFAAILGVVIVVIGVGGYYRFVKRKQS